MTAPLTEGWPTSAAAAAQVTADKYGPPDEASPNTLIWHDRTPWKRVVVSRAIVPHRFPHEHVDVVQHVVEQPVPMERLADLARFNGSVVYDRTRGELSSHCEDEEGNILALNLAHDVVAHGMDPDAARRRCHEAIETRNSENRDPYLDALVFEPGRGPDPDEATIDDELRDRLRHALGGADRPA
ncbi:hypothetical protein RB614_07820 [Phytohabitans sp. ZYX-F-186]|uniref:Uncharacterized protein n=1 Tax=Phytohabitans maris TaxID=3071409 RepID=A0ABU0ZDN0_9ACTN|nr:hypothetical protein [Phytohabitans sp. ZYX-F-186]MDQ7904430.1 hypothetical protein [Phytohabitans sp. ZYX-F-186]